MTNTLEKKKFVCFHEPLGMKRAELPLTIKPRSLKHSAELETMSKHQHINYPFSGKFAHLILCSGETELL